MGVTGTQFAIVRHGRKVKSFGQLRQLQRHNNREFPVGNVQVARSQHNLQPIGPKDLVNAVRAVLAAYGVDDDMANSGDRVIAREIIYTASPEFFLKRPGDPSAGWDRERVNAFARESLLYMRERWGDRIASAILHLDEASPHWHVVVVPAFRAQSRAEAEAGRDQRRQEERAAGTHLKASGREKVYRVRQKPARLDAKSLWPTKLALREEHDRFAAAMKGLGLTRGKRFSEEQKRSAAAYYADQVLAVTEAETARDGAQSSRRRLVDFEYGVNQIISGAVIVNGDGDDLEPNTRWQSAIKSGDERALREWAAFQLRCEAVWGSLVSFAWSVAKRLNRAIERRVEQELQRLAREIDREAELPPVAVAQRVIDQDRLMRIREHNRGGRLR